MKTVGKGPSGPVAPLSASRPGRSLESLVREACETVQACGLNERETARYVRGMLEGHLTDLQTTIASALAGLDDRENMSCDALAGDLSNMILAGPRPDGWLLCACNQAWVRSTEETTHTPGTHHGYNDCHKITTRKVTKVPRK